jgi:hypothetical protein
MTVFWDFVMDWSLMNPYAVFPFLRDELVYKSVWIYYFGIISNVVLRNSWMAYVILSKEKAYGPLIAFCLAFGEVFRKFIWCAFRMENEHIGKYVSNLYFVFLTPPPPPPPPPLSQTVI